MRKLLKKTLWGYILTYAITFFIVIGLLIPIYSMAYNSSRRVIEQNLTSSLSAGTERLAVAVHAADLYAYSLMEQDEMVNIAYRANIKNSHLINAKQLQKKLIDPFSTSATLIKDVVVLFINSDYVISKGIVQTRDKYWGNLIGIRGMTQAQFESQLLERREQFFPLTEVSTCHMPRRKPCVCLNYFSRTRLKPRYAICAIVPEYAIANMVYEETVAEHGWMRITDTKGNVLYESRADNLGECVEWEFTGGESAITMRAGVDKDVFARSVQGVLNTIYLYGALALIVFILMSAIMIERIYRPIREYASLLDSEWVTADENSRTLREAIRESMRRFSLNSEMLAQNLEELSSQYRNSVLLRLCNGVDDVPMEQLQHCFGENTIFNGTYVVIRLYTGEHGGTAALEDMRRGYWTAVEELKKRFPSYCVTSPRFLMIVGVDYDAMDAFDAQLEEICRRIFGAQERHDTVLRLARSTPHFGMDELKAACDEVNRIVLNIQPYVQEGRYLMRYEAHSDLSGAATLSTFYPNTLYSVLLSGEESAIMDQMRALRGQFTELYLKQYNRASAFYYNIVSAFELVMARLDAHIQIAEYDGAQSVYATCDYLDGIALQLGVIARAHARKVDGADAIIDFIGEHYCDSDMCLSLLSQKFKLSEAYISRMIKVRTGSTYTEYLELMRMRRAAELLRTTDKNVNDIALALGYETPNTFYKAFKRVYHVAPGAYRSGHDDDAGDKQVD